MPRFAAILRFLLGPVLALGQAGGVAAQVPDAPAGLHGDPGLIEMPNARMMPDADLAFSRSLLPEAQRTTLALQVLPWAQLVWRDAGVGAQGAGGLFPEYAGWDRSLDLRLRLWPEGTVLPSVALGVRDVLANGPQSAEYLVATKSLGPDLEATVGLGWGRLAGTNRVVTGRMRPASDRTGRRADRLFRGDVAAFGGLAFRTPIPGLSLLAEISSDNLAAEAPFGVPRAASALNYGLRYSPNDTFTLAAHAVQGRGVAAQVTARLNPADPFRSERKVVPPRPLSADAVARPQTRLDPGVPPRALSEAMAEDGVALTRFHQAGHVCQALIENLRHPLSARAMGRALRAIAAQPDADCRRIEIVLAVDGVPTTQLAVARDQVYRLDQDAEGVRQVVEAAIGPAPASVHGDARGVPPAGPRGDLWLAPYLRTLQPDPEARPYVDAGLRVRAGWRLGPATAVKGAVAGSVAGSFAEMADSPGGSLPRVRSDAVAYALAGLNGPRLETLYLEHLGRLSHTVFLRGTAGYLEEMYAGLSTEILWMSPDLPLAIGAEVNLVQARAYRQGFGTRTLGGLAHVNGHISLYWQTPLRGLAAQLDVGRYLAGDQGGTLTLSRHFSNGWTVGAFSTLTSASAAAFGEGRHDKGLFVQVPLAALYATDRRDALRRVIRPFPADGGQRVNVEGRLHERLRRDAPQGIRSTWAMVAR